jgi:ABC-2 type transport system permease protein
MSTAPAISLSSAPAAPRPGVWLAAVSLAWRELVRFMRQRHRVVGALLTPIVFWLLIGGGMGRSFTPPGGEAQNFIVFFFPGTVMMILLFTAIFSTISIIEDRREGFLQGVLVSPAPRASIALGKILGAGVLAMVHAGLFLIFAPLIGFRPGAGAVLMLLGLMSLASIALASLGFCLAWRMTSTQGFHAIMNLLLMPMWFLSGSLFPLEGAAAPVAWVMRVNPLTYAVAGMREALGGPTSAASPGLLTCFAVTAGFAVLLLLGAVRLVGSRDAGEVQ